MSEHVPTNALEIEVASDLFHVIERNPEDGTPVIGEVFYVVAVTSNGRRFILRKSFPNARWVRDWEAEFGGYVERLNGEARAIALRDRIANSPTINLDHWDIGNPVYGSEEYISSEAEQELIEWEKVLE